MIPGKFLFLPFFTSRLRGWPWLALVSLGLVLCLTLAAIAPALASFSPPRLVSTSIKELRQKQKTLSQERHQIDRQQEQLQNRQIGRAHV